MDVKHFSVNDDFYYTNHNITLLDLIRYFNYNDSLFVLELNRVITNKNKWQSIFISDKDTIEIVTIVGGG